MPGRFPAAVVAHWFGRALSHLTPLESGMPPLSAACPHCPKTVEIKFSTERLIAHSAPDGEECQGSGAAPAPPEAPTSLEPSATPPARRGKRKTKRKSQGKGGSVWTVSGGLPGLGKHR